MFSSLKSFALLSTALLFSTASQASPLQCQLAERYELPEGVEFSESCIETDMDYDNILWLVTERQSDNPLHKNYGFVNNKGEIVIPLKFSYANGFINGAANVTLDHEWGLIDTTGRLIIPNQYDYVSNLSEGLVMARMFNEDRRYGFLNLQNEIVIPFDYLYAEDFNVGYAVVGDNDKKGVIDKQNNLIVPMKYDYIYPFDSEVPEEKDWRFKVKMSDPASVAILNDRGEQIFPTYEDSGFFKHGLINVKKDDKWGFVDNANQTKIDFIYDDAVGFFSNMALVSKDGKYGFINPKGEVVIPLEYDDIKNSFYEDSDVKIVSANKGEIYYLLDRQGNETKTDYDEIGYFTDGLAPVKKSNINSPSGEYYGAINTDGELVIPLKYLVLTVEYGNLYHGLLDVVTEDNKNYIIDENGGIVADKTAEYEILKNY